MMTNDLCCILRYSVTTNPNKFECIAKFLALYTFCEDVENILLKKKKEKNTKFHKHLIPNKQ